MDFQFLPDFTELETVDLSATTYFKDSNDSTGARKSRFSDFHEVQQKIVFEQLATSKTLKEINLSGNKLRFKPDLGISSLFKPFYSDDYKKTDIWKLLTNKGLETVNLSSANLDDGDAAIIAKILIENENLKTINISGNNLTPKGKNLLIMAAFQRNKDIDIIGLGISSKENLRRIRELKNHPDKSLDMRDAFKGDDCVPILTDILEKNIVCKISCNGSNMPILKKVQAALRKNESLTSFHLSCKKEQVADAKEFVETLCADKTSLRTLDLEMPLLGAGYLGKFLTFLNKNKSLTNINLLDKNLVSIPNLVGEQFFEGEDKLTVNNFIFGKEFLSPEETQLILQALRSNSPLQTLYIRGSNKDLKEIAKALEENTSLRSFNFCTDRLEEEGAEAIATALRANSSLTSLTVSSRRVIGEQKLIIDALEDNKSLKSFAVHGFEVKAKSIIKLLENNDVIENIEIPHSSFKVEDERLIVAAVIKRHNTVKITSLRPKTAKILETFKEDQEKLYLFLLASHARAGAVSPANMLVDDMRYTIKDLVIRNSLEDCCALFNQHYPNNPLTVADFIKIPSNNVSNPSLSQQSLDKTL